MSGKGTLYKIHIKKGTEDYYYVGMTKNYRRRMEEHVGEHNDSRSAQWIKRNFSEAEKKEAITTKLMERDEHIRSEETRLTLELMIEFGVNRVRGAEYCKPEDYKDEEVENIVWACVHHLPVCDREKARRGLYQRRIPVASTPTPSVGKTSASNLPQFRPNGAAGGASDSPNLFTFGTAGGSTTTGGASDAPSQFKFGAWSSTKPAPASVPALAPAPETHIEYPKTPTSATKEEASRCEKSNVDASEGYCIVSSCREGIPMDRNMPACGAHSNITNWETIAPLTRCHYCGDVEKKPSGKKGFSLKYPACYPCWQAGCA